MTDTDIVITGVGICGPFGDARDTLAALRTGRSAVRRWTLPGVDGAQEIPAAPCEPLRPGIYLRDPKLAKYMNDAAKMAVVAAGRALGRAGLTDDEAGRSSLALYLACGLIAFDITGVQGVIEAARGDDGGLDLAAMGGEGLRRCHPLVPFKMLLNMPVGLVSIAFGIRGPNAALYPGPGQAAACLQTAFRGIEHGRFERALWGGTSNGLAFLPLCTLTRQGRIAASPEACVPFSPEHRGFAPSDAAACLVLESRAAAERRGVEPLALVTGIEAAFCPAGGWPPPRREVSEASDVVATGTLCAEDDERIRQRFGGSVRSFDGVLGYAGPAAFPLAVGLSAEEVAGRSVETRVVAWDPDGGRGAAILRGGAG